MTDLREAAFFDLDKTLMSGSSSMEFARVARTRGIISRRQVAGWAVDHLKFRLRGASDEETAQVLAVAQESVGGSRVELIDRMWPEVLAGILPRIYPRILAEVHRHQDEGRLTFIVSAAGSEMVESLARILGMDGGIGTRYAVEDGRYTGELAGPFVYGPGKVIAMEEIAADRGIDLAASWAYSDSASDLPMLEAVGNAVVVNPDPKLAAVASERAWEELRLDRIGRDLAVVGTITGLVAVATVGHFTIGQSEPFRRRRRQLFEALRGCRS
ncbi:MAG: HAD-IB family hydrolase [Solirubrobacterales bacterium]|nr:HAD-IB family hydrolase [Solirubrobacterales bacterium]